MYRLLRFKDLPFVPQKGQVIYIEPSTDAKVNRFIRDCYDAIRRVFSSCGQEFCYLPMLAEETVAYHAPYLSHAERMARVGSVPSLADYLVDESLEGPALAFALDNPHADDEGNTWFVVLPVKPTCHILNVRTFSALAQEVSRLSKLSWFQLQEELKQHDVREDDEHTVTGEKKLEYTTGEEGNATSQVAEPVAGYACGVKFSIETDNHKGKRWDLPERERTSSTILFRKCDDDEMGADRNFDTESVKLIEEIRQHIQALCNKGVNTMFLHDLIDDTVHLSRLHITSDNRIFLTDYNNMEIVMPKLPKAVFFLFLRHQRGIRFKELPDYYDELLQIYRGLHPIGSKEKHEQSIRDVTDPFSNSINEKCARIREAFVRHFDDHLARYYYITGSRGCLKNISLDRSRVIWEPGKGSDACSGDPFWWLS